MTYKETEHGGFYAEHQGPFGDNLPFTAEPLVFSREFTNGEKVITVSAAPVIPDWIDWDSICVDDYAVSICTEIRDTGDDSGDTSEYEWDADYSEGLTLPQAIETAKSYILGIDPEVDFA